MQTDILAAVPNGPGEIAGTTAVYPADKIRLHCMCDFHQIGNGAAGFHTLEIIVGLGIGNLGRQASLDGGSGKQGDAHQHRIFHLPQRIAIT